MDNQIFGLEEVNTGRQVEFDVARAFSILGMVISHCYMCSGMPITEGFANLICCILGTFLGAPLFMFYMGAGIRYSRHSSPNALIKRGFVILGIAYALNFFGRVLTNFVLDIIDEFGFRGDFYLEQLTFDDILQFAGLALILMGILLKLKTSDLIILIIGIAFSVLTIFTNNFEMNDKVASNLLGLIIGTSYDGYVSGSFPLLNYFIFVAAGYVFGKYWKRCKNKTRFFAIFSTLAFIIGSFGIFIEMKFEIGAIGTSGLRNYYWISLPDAILCFICAIGMSGIYYLFYTYFGDRFRNYCVNVSSCMNAFYVIHEILARWIVYFLLRYYLQIEMTNTVVLISSFVIIVITYAASMTYKTKKEYRLKRKFS